MNKEIEELREKIDSLDNVIIETLSKRKEIALEIANLKKAKKKVIYDTKREIQLKKKNRKIAKKMGLSETFVNKLYEIILKQSREEQK